MGNELRIIPALIFQNLLEKIKKLQEISLIEENDIPETSFTNIKNQIAKVSRIKDEKLKEKALAADYRNSLSRSSSSRMNSPKRRKALLQKRKNRKIKVENTSVPLSEGLFNELSQLLAQINSLDDTFKKLENNRS